MKLLLLFISIFVISYAHAQQEERDPYLEGIGYYDRENWRMADTTSVFEIIKKARKIVSSESARSEALCRIALSILENVESSEGVVRSYIGISSAKVNQNQNDSALYYVELAKPAADKAKAKRLIVGCLDQEAIVYAFDEQYDKCTRICFEAIKKGKKIDSKATMRSTATLGYVFMKLQDLKRSDEYSQSAYKLAKKYKDTNLVLSTLNVLSLNKKNSNHLDKAMELFQESLDLARASGNILRESQTLYNIHNVLSKQGKIEESLEYLNRSIALTKGNDTYSETAINFHGLAYGYFELGQLNRAAAAADSAIEYALLSQNYEVLSAVYVNRSNIAGEQNDFYTAWACMTNAYVYQDSMNVLQLRDTSDKAESDFKEEARKIQDSLNKVQQKIELKNERDLGNQRVKARENLIWVFVLAFILVLIAGYFIIRNLQLIKRQNALVNSQKEEIQQQHTEIRDSIDYAQRIQAAMINKRSEWDKLGTHFIFFRPKDVVSGDLYWAHNKGVLSIWVVADCTGHGVPGAFMSMLGFGFLNEIVIERNCSDAAEILNLLRSKIVAALGEQGENQARDGMDVSICIWNKKSNELQYAGANNPLWIIRHKSTETHESVKRITSTEESALHLLEIEPDKIPVGFVDGSSKPFTNKAIKLFPGDTIVQLTDGYADQFGGPQGKKMKYAPMKRLLIDMQSQQFDQQYQTLSKSFDDWRGDLEQVDDVCVVAVKVS